MELGRVSMKRTTIKDVAAAAGVSITTVSHALSGGGALSQETRQRVMNLAKEMNYIPDWKGRNLKAVETKVIGLFTSSIRGYYGMLADAMYLACKKQGYELDIILAPDEDMLMRGLMGKRVDGAVILREGLSEQNINLLMEMEVPLVFLDRELSGETTASVLLDSKHTGKVAAEYLYQLGHRSFLFVEGSDTYDAKERKKGFDQFVKKQKDASVEYILGEFDQAITYKAMKNYLEQTSQLPDAIYAANDDSAFGCIRALQEKGYSIPKDVSIMGCDDIELGKWYQPSLTTFHTNIAKQGEVAATTIIDLVKKNHKGTIHKVKGTIIERDSCRKK